MVLWSFHDFDETMMHTNSLCERPQQYSGASLKISIFACLLAELIVATDWSPSPLLRWFLAYISHQPSHGAENATLSVLGSVGLLNMPYSVSSRASVARPVSASFSTGCGEPRREVQGWSLSGLVGSVWEAESAGSRREDLFSEARMPCLWVLPPPPPNGRVMDLISTMEQNSYQSIRGSSSTFQSPWN